MEIIKSFENYLKIKGFSKNTLNAYLRIVNRYISFLEYYDFNIMSDNGLIEYIQNLYEKKYSPATLEQITAALQSFMYFLTSVYEKEKVQKGILIYPKKQNKINDFLHQEDIKLILDSFNKNEEKGFRNYLIVLIRIL